MSDGGRGCAYTIFGLLTVAVLLVYGGAFLVEQLGSLQEQAVKVEQERTQQKQIEAAATVRLAEEITQRARDYNVFMATIASMKPQSGVPSWFVAYAVVLGLAVVGMAYVTWYERRQRKAGKP